MTKQKNTISRRKFIGQSSCAAIGFSSFMSALLSLKSMNAAAMSNSAVSASGDYKALVCFSLSGGNDAFNMLMPRTGTPYTEYATTRTNLAIDPGTMLPITPGNPDGRDFGLHPSMPMTQSLFNSGNLAFINNIGTLIEPTTQQQIYDRLVDIPLGLYSHADQLQQWMTGLPHERASIGWGGKMADMIRDMNLNQNISMNISLSGTNIFQVGNEVIEYAIDPYDGGIGIFGYETGNMYDAMNTLRTQAIDNMLDASYDDIYQRTYVDVVKNSVNATREFRQALDQAPTFDGLFSDNYVSQQFKMTARTIAVHEILNVKRQTFFIDFGGWDHHDEVLNEQAGMLYIVDQALNEFNQAMIQIGCHDAVITFTMSEFARTLTSNGNGTDHAWGTNVMVMGGPVNGGLMYGDYPSLALGNPLDLGYGSLIPTTSTDEYFAELALWFGVSKTDLPILFPNLTNFYSTSSPSNPIGFLTI